MRFAALALVVLLGCRPEPEPGDPGYVSCQTSAATSDCEEYDACCQVLDDAGEMACWYETADGRTWDCASAFDCTQAAEDLVCATCDFASPGTPYSICG